MYNFTSRQGKNSLGYILATIPISIAILTSFYLTSTKVSADDDTIIDPVSVTVSSSCSISGIGTTHSANLKNGTYSGTEGLGYENGIGKTTMTAFCNDQNGFSIYAVGFTGDREGNNTLVGTNTNLTIASGTATSGETSNWAMKVTKVENPVSGAEITYHPENMTITNSFNNFHTVPDDYTKVAEYHAESGSSVTDQGTGALGAKLETTYAAFISPDQTADTYIGKVKYVLVHPYNGEAPELPPPTLYDLVASAWEAEGSRVQTNDTNANTGIKAAITTSNSGVFKYNPSTFGTSSDASNDHDIYYYRGILDTTTGSYGSDGDNAAHPNTVLLDANNNGADTTDTCWRIVRTTGSGGVKLIYQGKWTGSTCANATTSAQVTISVFNGTSSSTNKQIVRVGYTYNSTYATNTAQSGTIAQIFGTNSTASVNDTRSDIKTYIEDTWYTNNMTAFTSILEPSAGYCNDRTMNTTASWTTPLAESSTIAATYGTSSSQVYYFGAYPRNQNGAQPPSLTCGNKYSEIDRSTVDLYRYNGTNNAAGSATANYLKYPAALLTANETSFAGSGSPTASQGSSYHANSYLSSGYLFWLLSPSYRASNGGAVGFALGSNGQLYYFNGVSSSFGVRPTISLISGTMPTSGTGTATDPWVVTAP